MLPPAQVYIVERKPVLSVAVRIHSCDKVLLRRAGHHKSSEGGEGGEGVAAEQEVTVVCEARGWLGSGGGAS